MIRSPRLVQRYGTDPVAASLRDTHVCAPLPGRDDRDYDMSGKGLVPMPPLPAAPARAPWRLRLRLLRLSWR